MQVRHDDPVARLKAAFHDPFVTHQPAQLDRPQRGLAVLVDDHHRSTGIGHGNRRLRDRDDVGRLARINARINEFTRQQQPVGIGKFGAQFDGAGGFVDSKVEEFDQPGNLVFGPVGEHQPDLDCVIGRQCQLASGDRAADLQHFGSGLRKGYVDRRNLLDPRHQRAFGLRDERAFGHCGTPRASGDRRAHGGVAQLERCRFQLGLDLRDIGIRLARGGLCGVEFLAADGVFLDQRAIALHYGIGIGRRGLRTFEAGLRLRVAGAQFGRIDAEQWLSLSDIGAFLIQALLDDAGDARTHFGDADRFHPAGQFEDIVDIRLRNGDGADRDCLALRRLIG